MVKSSESCGNYFMAKFFLLYWLVNYGFMEIKQQIKKIYRWNLVKQLLP